MVKGRDGVRRSVEENVPGAPGKDDKSEDKKAAKGKKGGMPPELLEKWNKAKNKKK